MPASIEFRWLMEMAGQAAKSYPYRWIAIDGFQIKLGGTISEIIVADAESLGEVFEKVGRQERALSLYYAFIQPPLEPVKRS